MTFVHLKRRNAASGCRNGHSLLNGLKLTVFHKPFLFLALILTFNKRGDINYGSVLFSTLETRRAPRSRTSELKQLNRTSPSVMLSSTTFLSFHDSYLHDAGLLKAFMYCSFDFSLCVFFLLIFNLFPFVMWNLLFSCPFMFLFPPFVVFPPVVVALTCFTCEPSFFSCFT